MVWESAIFVLNKDDTIYLFLLVCSIGFGHYFRSIQEKTDKKWTATMVGFIIVTVVSGWHILHSVITTIVVGMLITVFKNRYCHIVSFMFCFCYLLFMRTALYVGLPVVPPHTNLIQMMLTLKLVGLAFEVRDSDEITEKMKRKDAEVTEKEKYRVFFIPNFMEVVHYCFCYIGVLTGPYYTYRTYWDMFHNTYTNEEICWNATIKKFESVPIFILLYFATNWMFPLKYLDSGEFYEECGFFYRLWYMYPTFFIFRLRMYIGLTLSECVCTMGGLGLYPTVTEPRPGSGPSTMFIALEEPEKYAVEHVTKGKYSFECIHNIDPGNAEFKPTVRFAMRYWNMTVQYWLATYVYSRFPQKDLRRTLAVFIVSAVWHGIHGGYYLSLLSVPFYLIVEDMYEQRFRYNAETISKQMKWLFILYLLKMLQFSWWGTAFQLLYVKNVLRYWSSVYFFPYFVAIAMYAHVHYENAKAARRGNIDTVPVQMPPEEE